MRLQSGPAAGPRRPVWRLEQLDPQTAQGLDAAGQTPAMYAALFQRRELLEALRERNADLTASDAFGNAVENLARGEIRSP